MDFIRLNELKLLLNLNKIDEKSVWLGLYKYGKIMFKCARVVSYKIYCASPYCS